MKNLPARQQKIYDFLKERKEATLDEIVKAMPWTYFHNRNKYIGEILSKMVNKKIIKRLAKGVYGYIKPEIIKQNTIFD